MSAEDVLSELASIGAVGKYEYEEDAPPEVAATPSRSVEIANPEVTKRFDPEKVEEMVAICDRLLQIFKVLASAYKAVPEAMQDLRDRLEELRTDGTVAVPVREHGPIDTESDWEPEPAPITHRPGDEEDEVPVDIDDHEFEIVVPSTSYPAPTAVPPVTRPSAPPPVPVALNPEAADNALVEEAMRQAGLR